MGNFVLNESYFTSNKLLIRFSILILVTISLFCLNLFFGAVEIPASIVLNALFANQSNEGLGFIITESRLPQAIAASLAGVALSVSGLMLQTTFRNPLAGPSILGISSGAGMGVAIVMLLLGGGVSIEDFNVGGRLAVLLGALLGSLAVMSLLMFLSSWLRNALMLLIAGIMLGYLSSSLVTLLNYFSNELQAYGYTMWGMGSFNVSANNELYWMGGLVLFGLILAIYLIKPLNLLLLGENYASNLGLRLSLARNIILLSTGVLTAAATAFCGPISFIGLAVPHLAKLLFQNDDHRIILPATALSGAAVALACNLISTTLCETILPINAITPLFGAPLIIYIIAKRK